MGGISVSLMHNDAAEPLQGCSVVNQGYMLGVSTCPFLDVLRDQISNLCSTRPTHVVLHTRWSEEGPLSSPATRTVSDYTCEHP